MSEHFDSNAKRTGLSRVPSATSRRDIELVVIGASTGGPAALSAMLSRLPKDFGAPVVVAQHMPAAFTSGFAEDLDAVCELKVVEGRDGLRLKPGIVVVIPGGRQGRVQWQHAGLTLRISNDCEGADCCPSVDRLFESAAEACGDRTLALVMTGMGSDGTVGCRALRNRCAQILAQDAATSVVFGMPGKAIAAGLVDDVVALGDLARNVVSRLGKKT